MKKLVILLIFPLLFSFDTQREDAFQTGEWFKFRVHYGLINAGYATLEVKDGVINNKKVYHVIGKGYSTGMSRFFFKVDDLYESYFDKVSNPADGAYYIETLTEQLAEKALSLFKEIEEKGGFITQLIEGKIQKKISESAAKEQELFDTGKEVLLGTNKYPNKNDKMKHDLELFPFVKQNPRKTLIVPIIEKRLAEKMEQERLSQEQ
jgi:hypothetical protein